MAAGFFRGLQNAFRLFKQKFLFMRQRRRALRAPCSLSSCVLRLSVCRGRPVKSPDADYRHLFRVLTYKRHAKRVSLYIMFFTGTQSNAWHHSWPCPGLNVAFIKGEKQSDGLLFNTSACICNSNSSLTICKLWRALMPECDACVRAPSPQSPGGAGGSFQPLTSLRQETSHCVRCPDWFPTSDARSPNHGRAVHCHPTNPGSPSLPVSLSFLCAQHTTVLC